MAGPVRRGLVGFLGVPVFAAMWETEGDLDRMLSSASILFLHLPVLAWSFAEGGRRKLCGRHPRNNLARWMCPRDHGTQRLASWLLAFVTFVPVVVLVALRAWEGAALLSLLPVGFTVVAAGYRSQAEWEAAMSEMRAERRPHGEG